ncbi:MAG TPA: tetratricopeptide repeat protein [Sandaracinaceae bacterium]
MRKTLTQRSTIAALVVSGITGLLLCLSPLLGTPGIESALVLGLVLPPFCGAIGARVVDRLRREGGRVEAAELFADAVAGALAVLALPALLLALNTLRVPVCAPVEGLAFLLLGPAIGVVLAACAGVVVSLFVPRVRWATAIAALLPIGAILLALHRFYATPAIFAYGHFFGYFPGTLYDPDVTVTLAYASFRAVSAAWILGIAALVAALWDPDAKTARLGVLRVRWRMGLAASLCIAAALAGGAYGAELGHRSTAESIAKALGGRLESARCVVVFPREVPRRDAVRLGEDCDVRVTQAERVLGLRQRERVTAFVFRSADEKRALMGASNTYIAKPWRNEVYLQAAEHPHPVLFHEIVHVVVGNAGRGPFRIAGGLGGLLPSPGIIEGTAVAIAWEPHDGLTPHQWARAMLELGLAPSLESMEGLAFLLEPASRAYTASGSFVRWMLETEGNRAVRTLYATGDFEAALGRPLAEAERDWHRFLREEVPLPDEARALARLRFERPGIFAQICPHAIANMQVELGADLSAGDDRAAVRTCGAILSLDPGQAGVRALLVGALARLGRTERARAELDALVGPPSAAPPLLFAARQALADAHWQRGERAEAERIYRELLEEPASDEALRQIEVRLLALEMGGAGERALRGLLVPRRDRSADPAIAMAHIAALERVREDGLAAYLEARQLAHRQRYDLALPRIADARRRGLPTARLVEEARRLEAVARFGAGDLDGSARIWREILRDPESSAAERLEASDWLTRIRLSR